MSAAVVIHLHGCYIYLINCDASAVVMITLRLCHICMVVMYLYGCDISAVVVITL